MEHQPGDIVYGRYKIISIIGQGGFGETYLAEDTHIPDLVCVIKYLRPLINTRQVLEIAQQRFSREAEVMRRLGKDNQQIPEIYNFFRENGRFYLVQEYIEGESLEKEITPRSFSETQVIAVLYDVLKILDYLSLQEIIHRDIKPANLIRRRRDNKIFLIDFGAVKEVVTINAQGQTDSTSILIGTPHYMPPEQKEGRPIYASDIYALGITGFQLLTGRIPRKNQKDEIIWNGEQVSPRLKEILDKMVRSNFQERYESASDVLFDLEPLSMLGQKLNQRYNITSYLGGGGYSHTYLADTHRPYQPNCIIKQLKLKVNRPQILQEALSCFDTGLSSVEKIHHHDQIPRLLDHFQINQEFYLVYEFIDGKVLSQQIKEGECLKDADVIALLKEVLDILTFIHQHGVIHGDIKPSNLIRRQQDGKIMLIDFAAFKQIIKLDIDHHQKILINPGGSRGYMPPEQQVNNILQLCSDIYALGMTAIQALTGVLPDQLLRDADNEVMWEQLAPAVSPKLKKILNKMVRFLSTERYQFAQDVLQDLDDLNNWNWWWRKIVKFKPVLPVILVLGVFGISRLCFVLLQIQDTTKLFREGLALMSKEDYTGAIKKFDEALKKSPNTLEILVNKGYAYGKMKNFPEQFHVCKQATESEPNSARAWLCLGNADTGLKLYKESIQDFQKAIDFACNLKDKIAIQDRESMNQDCSNAWNNKGEVFSELGNQGESFSASNNRQKALEAFEQAIQKNPNHYVAWTNKGKVLLQQKSCDKAETAFNTALSIQPNYPRAKEYLNKAQECLNKAQ